MGIRDWLAIIVIIFIVLILLDGFRRKWQERKTRIVMKLDRSIPQDAGVEDDDVLIKSELPNGGARTKRRAGDGEDVPVLMESVELDDDEFEEYPDPEPEDEEGDEGDDDGYMDDGDLADEELVVESQSIAGVIVDDEDTFDVADDLEEDEFPAEDRLDPDSGEDPWAASDTDDAASDEPEAEADAAPEKSDKRPFLSSREKAGDRIEPTFGDEELTFSRDDQGELDLGHHDLFESVEAGEDGEEDNDADDQEQVQEVIIINVMAQPNQPLEGSKLLPVLLKQGMRLGGMSIFHRHADMNGKGPVMFSMANMVKPGTFSMSEMETFTTPGVSLFMQMPNKLGNMQCFEQMLKTAEAIKTELNAQLKDENRSVFTRQTIEHSRQRIRDFELEMLARK